MVEFEPQNCDLRLNQSSFPVEMVCETDDTYGGWLPYSSS